MGCGSCGVASNGKPTGCKSNGGCSSGGCNRMNVFDWLNNIPLHDSAKPYPVIEVSFNNGSRKEFYRNGTHHIFDKGDWVAVEGIGGYDIGQVCLTGELVKLQLKKYGVTDVSVTKRVLHPATNEELQHCNKQKEREAEILIRSRAIARSMNLEMKLCEVEIQADSKKGTFFYTADQRVDFRELIKLYAGDFKMKVEMRQIGARQESGKVGGIGSCGRELCCSTWLTDFKSVNTTAARYQNLSINQTKLSGQCGRLKCCLNYELDTYMDALSVFPDHADNLETVKGIAHLQKRDIFRNLMWYSYSENNKQYPLTIARVKEIQKLNKDGVKAEELQPVEIETRETKSGILPDAGFINDVGQLSLKSLEKNSNKKKKHGSKGQTQLKVNTDITPREPNQAQVQGNKQQNKKANVQQKPMQISEQKPNMQPKPNVGQSQPQVQKGNQKAIQPQQNKPKPAQPQVQQKPNQPQQETAKVNQPQKVQPKPNQEQNRPAPNQRQQPRQERGDRDNRERSRKVPQKEDGNESDSKTV